MDPSTWGDWSLFAKTGNGSIIPNQPVQYHAEAGNIKKVLKLSNFPAPTSVTHLGRKVMSEELEVRGVPPEQARRLAMWVSQDVHGRHYLNHLPLAAMRGVAMPNCPDPKKRGLYCVPRTQVGIEGKGKERRICKQMQVLKKHIFPWMNDMWEKFHANQNCFEHLDIAASTVSFLKLLDWLREVILQVCSMHKKTNTHLDRERGKIRERDKKKGKEGSL